MKKRVFSVLMFLLMTITLVACSTSPSVGDTGNQTDNNQTIDPQTDPLAFLEAAGEKLKNAKSFETTVKKWDGAKRGQQYSSEAEAQYIKIQYVANLSGAPASYQEMPRGNDTKWLYFSGNSGFSGKLYDGEHIYDATHMRDENFTPLQHFSLLEFTLDLRSSTMFDTACQFDHSVTTQGDESTTIAFEGLNGEDLLSIMNLTSPFYIGWQDAYSLVSVQKPIVEGVSYTLSFSVDAQGYLCEIRVVRTDTVASGPNISQTCAVSFAQINQKMPLEEAGYTDQFRLSSEQTHPDVFHHFGDFHTAEYFYMDESGTYGVWLYYIGTERFVRKPIASQEELWDQDVIHHYYKVLTAIDGIPVSEQLNFVGGMYIDKLIIPKNLYMMDDGFSTGTEALFFEETRDEYYNSQFIKQWIKQHSGYDLNTNCYFAGEWKYVDGVPTPNA